MYIMILKWEFSMISDERSLIGTYLHTYELTRVASPLACMTSDIVSTIVATAVIVVQMKRNIVDVSRNSVPLTPLRRWSKNILTPKSTALMPKESDYYHNEQISLRTNLP